jgi:hypothetical protein
VAVLPQQLLPVVPVVPPLAVLMRQLRRRRKRVRCTLPKGKSQPTKLTCYTEKEESDEDMGFGLFD